MICACLVGFFVSMPSLHPLNIHGMFFCSLVSVLFLCTFMQGKEDVDENGRQYVVPRFR